MVSQITAPSSLLSDFNAMFSAEYKSTFEVAEAAIKAPDAFNTSTLEAAHHFPKSTLQDGQLQITANKVNFKLKNSTHSYTVNTQDLSLIMKDKETFSKMLDVMVVDVINKTYFDLGAKKKQNDPLLGLQMFNWNTTLIGTELTITFKSVATPVSEVEPTT
jgi:hypothetical protein